MKLFLQTILIIILIIILSIFILTIVILVITCKNEYYVNQKNTFIKWEPKQNCFLLNDKQFYAIGCNMPWMGLIVANNMNHCFVQPSDKDVIDTLTYARQELNCNIIRCHTLGFSAFSENSFIFDGKINQNYWKIVDLIIRTSKQLGLYLIPVLTDQYNGYNGNYNIFLGSDETSADFYKINSQTFKNYTSFINEFLNHEVDGIKIRDEPNIFCLEFGNELGDHFGMSASNCIADQNINCAYDPSQKSLKIQGTTCPVPTKEWFVAIKDYIRTIDNNHMLMTGANWCQLDPPIQTGGQSCDWNIDGIDIVSFHWYFTVLEDMTDFYYETYDINRFQQMKTTCEMIRKANKAVIFGEYPATYGHIKNFFENMSEMLDNDLLQGELFWDLVYDEYLKYGADTGKDSSAPQGFAVAPNKDAELLKTYAEHFKKYKYNGGDETCMSLDDCNIKCGKKPQKDTINILLIGDSITAGFHCANQNCTKCGNCQNLDNMCDLSTGCKTITNKPVGAGNCAYVNNCSSSWADFMADILKTNVRLNINIHNNAIKGTTAIVTTSNPCQILYGGPYISNYNKCWDQSLQLNDVDFITIMFGTNDALKVNSGCFNNNDELLTEAMTQLQSMVDELKKKYQGSIIFLMRPLPSQSMALDLELMNNKYSQFSQINNINYIDLHKEITDYIGNNSYENFFCDTIHPFNNLNKKIGDIIANEMMKFINKGSINDPKITFSRCYTPCDDDK